MGDGGSQSVGVRVCGAEDDVGGEVRNGLEDGEDLGGDVVRVATAKGDKEVWRGRSPLAPDFSSDGGEGVGTGCFVLQKLAAQLHETRAKEEACGWLAVRVERFGRAEVLI